MNPVDGVLKRLTYSRGGTCLPSKVRVAFPSACNGCNAGIAKVKASLLENFFGFTSYNGEGGWLDKDGVEVVEPVRVFEAAFNCSNPSKARNFAQALVEAGQAAGQDTIGSEVDNSFLLFRSKKGIPFSVKAGERKEIEVIQRTL